MPLLFWVGLQAASCLLACLVIRVVYSVSEMSRMCLVCKACAPGVDVVAVSGRVRQAGGSFVFETYEKQLRPLDCRRHLFSQSRRRDIVNPEA